MNAINDTAASQVPQRLPSIKFDSIRFLNVVPSENFRSRMAAGLSPNCFFSFEGTVGHETQMWQVTCNSLTATGENGKLRSIPGIWSPKADGLAPSPVSMQRGYAPCEPDTDAVVEKESQRPVAMKPDGTPALLTSLPEGWKWYHVLKSICHHNSRMTLVLHDVHLTDKGKANDAGLQYVSASVYGEIEVVPRVRTEDKWETTDEVVTLRPAARRTSTPVAAVLP